MNIHLFKPTDLHRLFFENAHVLEPTCVLEPDINKADMIVIDDPLLIEDVYREDVVIAVLHEIVPETYPPNVVFVNKRGIVRPLVHLLKNVLEVVVN